MSQNPSPRSPRSPRSKSQSCDEGQQGGEENVPTADEIQEAVAEELRSPDRIISQGQQSVRSRGKSPSYASAPRESFHGTAPPSRTSYQGTAPQSRASFQGTSPQSRVSYHPSASSRPPTAPGSRIPSPRGASTCEEEPPRQPSPFATPGAYASQAASLGAGRAASPEATSQRSKPVSFQDVEQVPEMNDTFCPEDQTPDATYVRGPSQPSMRTTPAPSHPSMRGSPAYSHPSMRGSPAYSHPSMRESPAYSHPSMRESPAYSHPSMRGSPAYSHPSMREGTLPSNRGTPIGSRSTAIGSGVGPSAVTFGNQETGSPRMGSQRTMDALMAEPSNCSGQNLGDMEAGMSGIEPMASSMNAMRVDAGTSAMSYAPQGERSGGLSGCIPGCKTFMRDMQNAVSSTPCTSQQPVQQFPTQRQPLMGPQAAGGGRAPQHQGMSHEPAFTGPAASPTFKRGGTTPPSYMRIPSASDGEHHHHHHEEGHEGPPEPDERVVAAIGHLSQFKKTPSYFRCGVGQDLDFLKICGGTEAEPVKSGPGKVAAFPDIPCLRQEELDELVKCEAADVESAWFLTSDERKSYKKPCPKQQKAQMTVKALVQAHEKAQTCGKEYSPLEHPDPEDISPEVAAAMMFSQEKGIKMEECPHYTITNLFPDEPKPPFPEKIPASSISIVDRNSKDQEEMIEKSASVPSEGVSDSAYTRTMKEKGGEDMGAQRSFDVDFAIGQSKREYVLVTQKPQRVNRVQYRGGTSPPWFPGYFSAFPSEAGLKTVPSPSDLLYKAWIHSNPRNMPTSDVIVVD